MIGLGSNIGIYHRFQRIASLPKCPPDHIGADALIVRRVAAAVVGAAVRRPVGRVLAGADEDVVEVGDAVGVLVDREAEPRYG
jgi:hypothetical protein